MHSSFADRDSPLGTKLAVVLFSIAIASILSFHCTVSPPIWYDEGEFLLTARTVAEEGSYAIRLADGLRGAHLSVGPIVLVPLGILMRFFGTSLLVGRVFTVFCTCVCLLTASLFVSHHVRIGIALLAAISILFNPLTGFFLLGRTVQGEIPALLLLFAGLITFRGSEKRTGLLPPVLTGILFGLAVSAKPQAGLIFAALGLLGVTEWLRNESILQTVITGCTAAWISALSLLATISGVGWEVYRQHLKLLTSVGKYIVGGGKQSLFTSSALDVKLHGEFSLLVLIAAIYIFFNPSLRARRDLLLGGLLTCLWQIWFLFFSVGWNRYALIGESLGICLIIIALTEMTSRMARAVRFGVGGVALFGITILCVQRLQTINLRPISNPAAEMAARIDAYTEKDAKVESYEWEIGFLIHKPYLQPTLEKHYSTFSQLLAGKDREIAKSAFDLSSSEADYIVTGYFGTYLFQTHSPEKVSQVGEQISVIPPYALYRLVRHKDEGK